MTSRDADLLAGMVRDNKRVLQVGYYYRYHPMSVYTKTQIQESSLGNLRYLSGSFMGFKRTRTDVGVTHTDGIHFIDLFNWLVGEPPLEVYAIVRDHFGRGMEDASIVLIQYRNGVVGKVESGYIQPGKWHDKVVANAKTTKEIFVCGSSSTIEADYETDTLVVHDVRHEFNGITWAPVGKGSRLPSVGTGTPHQMICSELQSFLDRIGGKRRPHPDVIGSGVVLARVMEAIYESARRNTPVKLDWTPEQLSSLIEGGVQ
jgi:predicted dehydrogenase